MDFLRGRSAGVFPGRAKVVVVLLGLAVIAMIALRGVKLAPAVPPATRAYLALRALLGRRQGAVGPAVPPEEVARLFERSVPGSGEDARAVVEAYCEGAFGGRTPPPGAARDLRQRLRRVRKLAGAEPRKATPPAAQGLRPGPDSAFPA